MKVNIDDDVLIIRAETREPAATQDELMSSRRAWSFTRAVQLPNTVD
ncbi:MAG TPA: Hsp20/alpha crystallin family protein [Dehalococcoidia bacterium]|nr:Hsp20/alpha crystallin family protein [Dehalococcoidia bacterium]